MEEVDLLEYLQILLKRKFLIIALVVAAMATAYIVSSYMTPIYQAEATFLIKHRAGDIAIPFQEVLSGGTNQNLARNYVEILKSRTVMEGALKRLPEAPGGNGHNIEDFRKAVTAQVIQGTDAIRVRVQDPNRHRARLLANALVDVLIERNREMNRAATATAREYLSQQLEYSKVHLMEAEERLLSVRAGRKVVEPSAEARLLIQRTADLAAQIGGAQIAIGEAEARLRNIRQQLSGTPDRIVSQETVGTDPVVAGHRARLAELEVRLAGALQRYTESHPEVTKVKAEIAETQSALASAVARVVSTEVATPNPMRESLRQSVVALETEIAAKKAQVQGLKSVLDQEEERLSKLPQRELDLARVTRDLDVAQQIYVLLRTKYEEIRVTEQMQVSDIWRIDSAVTPEFPVKPRKLLNTAIAAVLGVFVGIGGAFVLEFMDTSMKSAEDVQRTLGLPVLGTVPKHTASVSRDSRKRSSSMRPVNG